MRCLFIDTSLSNIIVAITEDDKILDIYNEKSDTSLSARIIPIISLVFSNSKLNPNDIDVIFAVTGPGSFTGIRIGLTIAKTYAWTLNKKIIPISSLEVLATTPHTSEYIIPLVDARRSFVYTGIYSEDKAVLNDSYIFLDDLLKKTSDYKDKTFVSYDTFGLDGCVKPKIDIMKIIKNNLNKEAVNPHMIKPNYLKKTEAEEKLYDKRS